MTQFYRILMVLALLLPGLLHAQEMFKGAAAMEVPFPPGQRSITHLLNIEGSIYAIVDTGAAMDFFVVTGQPIPFEAMMLNLPEEAEAAMKDANRPLIVDMARQCGYTISPAGKLLKLSADHAVDIGQVAGTRPFEKDGYQVSRAMVVGPDGALYTAGANGAIFKYNPDTNKLEKTKAVIPAVKGREAWASLDAAAVGPDGLIYGGTFDGYLFTFDPKTQAVVNLGKPLRSQRIGGLAFRNGMLYGFGGDEQSFPRAFTFDPKTRGFDVGGPLPTLVNGPAYTDYEPIGAILGLPDGTIYFSTTGRLANLYVWKPEGK